ncbi:hypothetical protein ACFLS9_08545 [Bacteroidota bacterium]
MNIPKTIMGIKKRIEKYEKLLKAEKKKFGFIHDRAGLRYDIGPLYLLMDDINGSLKSFRWFQKNFPDDCGDPSQYLCWTLALFKNDNIIEAENKLIITMLQNLYLIPHILGNDQPVYNMWHSSNVEEKEYLEYLPVEYVQLWDEKSKSWLRNIYFGERCKLYRKRFIEINNQLQEEPVGLQRTKLVNELYELKNLNSE